jgi:hypothetical protein
MRLSNVVLVLALGGFAAISTTVGCGDDSSGSGGSGGSGSGSSSASSSGSGTAALPCDPTEAVCKMAKSSCIGLTENMGKEKFALRMSQLTVTKPPPLAMGFIAGVVASAVKLNLSQCNLDGGGTFNLLLEFDKAANKLKVGGAKPLMDPTQGYTFLEADVMGTMIKPLVADVTIGADGKFTPMAGGDIVLPIYLGLTDMNPGVLLPIFKAKISGTLTDENNCIGKYDAAKLDPKAGCVAATPFVTAADLDGHITLEEADKVIVTAAGNASLCVILSGDTAKYGDGAMPNKCKRTANVIDFKGDWCTGTDAAADAACFDSVKLQGSLAASSVKVN